MSGYEENFVAFLDILGFKKIVNTDEFEKVLTIFESIISGDEEAEKVLSREIESDTLSIDKQIIQNYNDALMNTRISIMSDSIVIATPCSLKESLAVVVDICDRIQMQLYELETPVLIRGAISKGDLFVRNGDIDNHNISSNTIIFGKGLVDAYLAQEYYAIYPRVIVSKEVMKGYKISIDANRELPEDKEDGYSYLDTLMFYLLKDETDKNVIGNPLEFYTNQFECREKYKRIKTLINNNLSGYEDLDVRLKYLWLDKEMERIKKVFLKNNGVEILSEGDMYFVST